ncbi:MULTISPECIES: IS701 family transposase [unclassified Streptomyces]|uniref:IS701 family transposase n=1 Tax=unclassified Streptomyces TaxID=2593676 RepID=UPI00099CACB1|nr:transposase [Streptomyces sp. NBC_00370]
MQDSADICRDGAITPDTGAVARFVDRIFVDLPRSDQRARAREYMTGLLATPGKKSLRRMAAVVSSSPRTSQALQQFLNDSPWDWRPVRRALAYWVAERAAVSSWTVAVAELPKRGSHSVGVHQRYSDEAHRTVNCQLGVGLFLDGEGVALPIDWRLVLPGRWRTDQGLRESARIPDEHEPPSAEDCVRDFLRTAREPGGGYRPPFVTDLTGTPRGGRLLGLLSESGEGFVARVPESAVVFPAGGSERPVTVGQLVRRASFPGPAADLAAPPAPGRHQVRACTVRLRPDGQLHRLVLGYPEQLKQAPYAVVADLVNEKPAEILRLAGAPARARLALRSMRRDGGLRDFEGRSYPGWHHHMTLVSAAHAFHLLGGVAPARRPAPELMRVA